MTRLCNILKAEVPQEYGIIDVGGKFVKTSDKEGPGLII
jgi:hypothetical protein